MRARWPAATLVLAAAAACALALPAACARGDGDGERGVTELPGIESAAGGDEARARIGAGPADDAAGGAAAGEPIGEALMVALAQARNHHHKADVLLKEGRVDEAAEALRQILTIPFPPGSPEGEDVLLDARARLAKLQLGRGTRQAVDEALEIVDQGIAAAGRPSFFLANLFTARGEVLEASALLLADAGDEAAARAGRIEAIEAFDRSIAINEALLKKIAREESR